MFLAMEYVDTEIFRQKNNTHYFCYEIFSLIKLILVKFVTNIFPHKLNTRHICYRIFYLTKLTLIKFVTEYFSSQT
jgi:hypothetical protein